MNITRTAGNPRDSPWAGNLRPFRPMNITRGRQSQGFSLGWQPPALQADEHHPQGRQSQGFSLGWQPPALQADEHHPHGRREDTSLGILDASDRAA
jgi:hypothetical protein